MSKRQVWVVERKTKRSRVWKLESVCENGSYHMSRKREWVGVDGARYRFVKYLPTESTDR